MREEDEAGSSCFSLTRRSISNEFGSMLLLHFASLPTSSADAAAPDLANEAARAAQSSVMICFWRLLWPQQPFLTVLSLLVDTFRAVYAGCIMDAGEPVYNIGA